MSNPAATPSIAVDVIGDDRWMSLVRSNFENFASHYFTPVVK